MVYNPEREDMAILARMRAESCRLKIAIYVASVALVILSGTLVWAVFFDSDQFDSLPHPTMSLILASFYATPLSLSSSSSLWTVQMILFNASDHVDPIHISPLFSFPNSTTSLLGDPVAVHPERFFTADLALNRVAPEVASLLLADQDQRGLLQAVVRVDGILKKNGLAVTGLCPTELHFRLAGALRIMCHYQTSSLH